MTATQLISKGIISKENLFDWIQGFDGWESVQGEINKATGLNKAILDIDTDEASNEDCLNAEFKEQY